MKKIKSLILISIFASAFAHAQLNFRLYNYRPTGDLGFLMKPTVSLQVGYTKPFEKDEKRIRENGSLTLIYLSPRQKEFPVTGSISSGSSTIVNPGVLSYQRFISFQAHGGFDVALINKEKFAGYIGTNLIAGTSFLHYSSNIENQIDDETITTSFTLGLQFRAGVEYKISDKLTGFVSANRNYMLFVHEAFYSANDYGLGIIFNFD